METTQQSAASILQSSFDAAVTATLSTLDELGIQYDRDHVVSKVKCKFDYILDDSGVRNNLMGKAYTVDQALERKLGSAQRNRFWMTNAATVQKLDTDVNRLRMLLASKGIDQDTRVLNTCFKVFREPGKSSAKIQCTQLIKEKLQRDEIIVVGEKEAGDEPMETNNSELAVAQFELKQAQERFTKYRRNQEDRIRHHVDKEASLTQEIHALKMQVSQLQDQISVLQRRLYKNESSIPDQIKEIRNRMILAVTSLPNLSQIKKEEIMADVISISEVNAVDALSDMSRIFAQIMTDIDEAFWTVRKIAVFSNFTADYE
nr:NSP3 [Rotavirus A]